jgi:hypothetical protein
MERLAVGGEKSFGPTVAVVMRAAANVREWSSQVLGIG